MRDQFIEDEMSIDMDGGFGEVWSGDQVSKFCDLTRDIIKRDAEAEMPKRDLAKIKSSIKAYMEESKALGQFE